ncbi:tyrosine-type recombinase/integrase [Mesorhizobium sp.]|uniref:tyrosine-type recombinase/integrase n=1 Tax=Mesorhizobium sp. TaxID=1871066 RepID=UPI0025CDC522|nr:tyrosine-type recombinase/integrase [Mesorhizobium sp.]
MDYTGLTICIRPPRNYRSPARAENERLRQIIKELQLGHGAHVRCVGKGRKERSTPLTKVAQQALRGWLNEPRKRGATALFPNTHGGKLSADGVQALLNKYVAKGREHCVTLRSKRVSPHVLRHSAAIELLQAGVDCSVIALWLP